MGARGEIKKMQNRRKSSRRRTIVRQRRFSAVEKADNYSLGEIRQDFISFHGICAEQKPKSHFYPLFRSGDFSRADSARDKKDAEASKIVTSPYLRTAEAIFGGRKSG